MKKIQFIIFFFSFLSLTNINAQGVISSDHYGTALSDTEGFIPVELNELEISDEGMYAYIQGEWVEILALVRDNMGRYHGKVQELRAPATTWPCPHCGKSNEFWRRKYLFLSSFEQFFSIQRRRFRQE